MADFFWSNKKNKKGLQMKNITLLFVLIVWSGHASSNSMTIYCERLIDVVKGEILYRQEIEIAG